MSERPIYAKYDLSLVERINFIRRKPEIKETLTEFVNTAARERAARLEAQYLDVWANGIKRDDKNDVTLQEN